MSSRTGAPSTPPVDPAAIAVAVTDDGLLVANTDIKQTATRMDLSMTALRILLAGAGFPTHFTLQTLLTFIDTATATTLPGQHADIRNDLKGVRQMLWNSVPDQLVNGAASSNPCFREVNHPTDGSKQKVVAYTDATGDLQLRRLDTTWGDELEIAEDAEFCSILETVSGEYLIAYYNTAGTDLRMVRSSDLVTWTPIAAPILTLAQLQALNGGAGFTNLYSTSLQQDRNGDVHCVFVYLDASGGLDDYHVQDIFDNSDDGATWTPGNSYNIYTLNAVGPPDVIIRAEISTIISNAGLYELFLVFDDAGDIKYMRTLSAHPTVTADWGTDVGAFTDTNALDVYAGAVNDTEPTGFMSKGGVIYVLFTTNEDGTDDVKAVRSLETVTDAALVVWVSVPIDIFKTPGADVWPSAIEDTGGNLISACISDYLDGTDYVWTVAFNSNGFIQADMFKEVVEIERHLHNCPRPLPYTVDGANLTPGVTLTAAAGGGFGVWAPIETAANLQTAFPGMTRMDPNKVMVRGASANKVWDFEMGYGPNAGAVTRLSSDGFESVAGVTGKQGAPESLADRMPLNGTDNLYGRVRGTTNGGTIDVIVWAHAYPE